MKKIMKLTAVFLSVMLVLLFAGITVLAEPEGEYAPETVTEPSTQELTDEPTEPPTEPPTEAPTEPETEEISQETEPTEESSEESLPSEDEPSYNVDDLPEIEENEFIVPTALTEEAAVQSATALAGIVSWLCVAVGIIVIIAILGSSKAGNYMNGGKQRYESGDIISGGRRR